MPARRGVNRRQEWGGRYLTRRAPSSLTRSKMPVAVGSGSCRTWGASVLGKGNKRCNKDRLGRKRSCQINTPPPIAALGAGRLLSRQKTGSLHRPRAGHSISDRGGLRTPEKQWSTSQTRPRENLIQPRSSMSPRRAWPLFRQNRNFQAKGKESSSAVRKAQGGPDSPQRRGGGPKEGTGTQTTFRNGTSEKSHGHWIRGLKFTTNYSRKVTGKSYQVKC